MLVKPRVRRIYITASKSKEIQKYQTNIFDEKENYFAKDRRTEKTQTYLQPKEFTNTDCDKSQTYQRLIALTIEYQKVYELEIMRKRIVFL